MNVTSISSWLPPVEEGFDMETSGAATLSSLQQQYGTQRQQHLNHQYNNTSSPLQDQHLLPTEEDVALLLAREQEEEELDESTRTGLGVATIPSRMRTDDAMLRFNSNSVPAIAPPPPPSTRLLSGTSSDPISSFLTEHHQQHLNPPVAAASRSSFMPVASAAAASREESTMEAAAIASLANDTSSNEWVCPTNIFFSDDSDEEDLAETAMLLTAHHRRMSGTSQPEDDISSMPHYHPVVDTTSSSGRRCPYRQMRNQRDNSNLMGRVKTSRDGDNSTMDRTVNVSVSTSTPATHFPPTTTRTNTHRMTTRSSASRRRSSAREVTTTEEEIMPNTQSSTATSRTSPFPNHSESRKRPALKSGNSVATKKKKTCITICDETDNEEDDKKVDASQKCCICLEIPTPETLAKLDSCDHVYCFDCIEQWSERENSCPQCKARFTQIELVNKVQPKKGELGGEEDEKVNVKKVKKRDQSADFMQPFHHIFAGMENLHMPQLAQFILSGLSPPTRRFTWEPATPGTLVGMLNGPNNSSTENRQSASRSTAERIVEMNRRFPRPHPASTMRNSEIGQRDRSANDMRNYFSFERDIQTSDLISSAAPRRAPSSVRPNIGINAEYFPSESSQPTDPGFAHDFFRGMHSADLSQLGGQVSFSTRNGDRREGSLSVGARSNRADSPHPFNNHISSTASQFMPRDNSAAYGMHQNSNAGTSADDPLEILDSDDESTNEVVEVVIVN